MCTVSRVQEEHQSRLWNECGGTSIGGRDGRAEFTKVGVSVLRACLSAFPSLGHLVHVWSPGYNICTCMSFENTIQPVSCSVIVNPDIRKFGNVTGHRISTATRGWTLSFVLLVGHK